ncbi:MAG: hypothetical protein OEZ51_11050 [Nitrospinota bacterium]|nr:hypothetical protein [Nitrospinota bacterium]
MSKAIQPSRPKKNVHERVKSGKKKARIGFLESMGDSGYDNRTDPNYCSEIFQKFMRKEEFEGEETLD